jgi:hypothetical protein
MECEKMIKQVCDELAEDINSNFCESLTKHLEECEDCRAQVGAMRNTVKLYKCLEKKVVPVDIHNRLLKMLNIEDPQK